MDAKVKWTLVGVGALGAGFYGWYQFRMYVRKQVEKTLNDPAPNGFDFDQKLKSNLLAQIGSSLLDLPSAAELAESTTPIWSIIHPNDAFDDILLNGRESIYWPKHRQTTLPKSVDTFIFKLLRTFNEFSKQQAEQQKQLTG